MMCKAAGKPARACYQNTLQTESPGSPGAMHYLMDIHALAVLPWASHFTFLNLSICLCKTGFKTISISQSCCEAFPKAAQTVPGPPVAQNGSLRKDCAFRLSADWNWSARTQDGRQAL